MNALTSRSLAIVLGSAVLLLAALVGFNLFRAHMIKKFLSQNAQVPATVTAATAARLPWQPQINAVGTLRAFRGVDITTEVPGLVRALRFASGASVKAGDVLVELNADADVAQQHALEAAADLAATVFQRDQVQYEAQAISKAQLEASAGDVRNRRAQAEAQAALAAKKTLRAPFAGRLGISTVNPGQYLNAGDKVVTLQAIEPIYLDFRVPQSQLGDVASGQAVTVGTDTYPGREFRGRVTAIDPKVDPATRNVWVEALVDNRERLLMPGMFARVTVATGKSEERLTLPQSAVVYNAYGTTVFLVEAPPTGAANPVTRQVFVTLGATRGDQVAVLSGLNAGQQVVTSGMLKLKNGTPLIIDNTVVPKNDPNPTPQER